MTAGRRRLRLAFSALVAAWVCGVGAGETRLQHNPFARPAQIAEPPSVANSAQAPRIDAEPPVLSATLASPVQPMAILNGHLMSVGDEHDGYRLVEVEEGFAVFQRNRTEVRLQVTAAKQEKRRR